MTSVQVVGYFDAEKHHRTVKRVPGLCQNGLNRELRLLYLGCNTPTPPLWCQWRPWGVQTSMLTRWQLAAVPPNLVVSGEAQLRFRTATITQGKQGHFHCGVSGEQSMRDFFPCSLNHKNLIELLGVKLMKVCPLCQKTKNKTLDHRELKKKLPDQSSLSLWQFRSHHLRVPTSRCSSSGFCFQLADFSAFTRLSLVWLFALQLQFFGWPKKSG